MHLYDVSVNEWSIVDFAPQVNFKIDKQSELTIDHLHFYQLTRALYFSLLSIIIQMLIINRTTAIMIPI